jgi:predicted Rossmann fold flavoprotein
MSAPVDVLVLGGGAAGLFCAMIAGQRGKSVLVLERAERVGKKILVSGGGRCNFTNLGASPANYLSAQPDFCRSALARYSPEDFVQLVEKHGIAYHEKKLGQLFCDGSSREIVAMLLAECAQAGVRVETGCEVGAAANDGDGLFSIEAGRPGLGVIRARALVVATGGLSWPQLGGSSLAYRIARGFGLRVTALLPALAPLVCTGDTLRRCVELSGVSVDCLARPPGKGAPAFREHLLFTHRGLSGPAILQASSYLAASGAGGKLVINLLPDEFDAPDWLLGARARGREILLNNLLAERLPARLAHSIAAELGQPRSLRQYSVKALDALGQKLHHWLVEPSGNEGYGKAEVTLGGVDTRDLHGKTMEARNQPGLYFIGEAVDVTGQLGGYNFQWAWASGYASGNAV